MNPQERRQWLRDMKYEIEHVYDSYNVNLVPSVNPIDNWKKRRSFVRMAMAGFLDDETRKAVVGWLFRDDGQPLPTAEQGPFTVLAMEKWIKPVYDHGVFLVSAEFRDEIEEIVKEM